MLCAILDMVLRYGLFTPCRLLRDNWMNTIQWAQCCYGKDGMNLASGRLRDSAFWREASDGCSHARTYSPMT